MARISAGCVHWRAQLGCIRKNLLPLGCGGPLHLSLDILAGLTEADDPLTDSTSQLQAETQFLHIYFSTEEIQTSSEIVCLLYHTSFEDASFSASADSMACLDYSLALLHFIIYRIYSVLKLITRTSSVYAKTHLCTLFISWSLQQKYQLQCIDIFLSACPDTMLDWISVFLLSVFSSLFFFWNIWCYVYDRIKPNNFANIFEFIVAEYYL